MRAYERFLNYAKIPTASDGEAPGIPSSEGQAALASLLAEEMRQIGISHVRLEETCCVYGEIPPSAGQESAPAIGLIAHMDTSPDFSGEGVSPQVIPDYDGGDVILGESGRVLTVKEFPHLSDLKGRTLITTDGTTLLGADDKAGIAEILTMAEEILREGTAHGKICIAFTPDEEIGRGPDAFDVQGFGADYAYTVDGCAENEIEYENFNAASAVAEIRGFSVHPGSGKNTMINAALTAMEFNSMLPAGETPRDTEGYEGFYHLTEMSGDVSSARLSYLVRDHSASFFEARLQTMRHIAKLLNEKYGEGTVKLTVAKQYRNMREQIEPCMHLIDNAKKSAVLAGLRPVTIPIRGGTDGARLSFMGLPCPNLGTGGYAAHGPYEHVTAEGMDAVVLLLKNIINCYLTEPSSV